MSIISASTTSTTAYKVTADTTGTLVLQTGSSPTTAVTIDTSQNVGVGTTPTEKLTVNGNIKLGISGTSWIYGPATTGRSIYSNSDSTAYIIAYGSSYGGSNDAGLSFVAGTSNVMTFNSSGNIGIGVTPSAWGSSFKALQMSYATMMNSSAGGYYGANFYYNSSGNPTYVNNGYALAYSAYSAGGAHLWLTAPSGTAGNSISFTQAMTLDNSGNLMVKATSAGGVGVTIYGQYSTQGLVVWNTSATSADNAYFKYNGTVIGSIATTTTTTAFVTTSDYRLKENVAPMTGALAKVAALKPCTYTWKLDGSYGEGFIAHELQEVVAGAVTGEKDATTVEQYEISPAVPATFDDEGNELTPAVEAVIGEREVPKYQGIDTSFLVATLTAAIQEQQAIIETLTNRITALEAK